MCTLGIKASEKTKNKMKYLVDVSWHAFAPVLELTAPRGLVRFIDQNFTIITTSVTLFAALVMWANI